MRLAIFTAGYADSGSGLYLMEESAIRHGHRIISYGGAVFPGWLDGKVRDALPFLRSVANDYDLLMWVDGFDSLVLHEPTIVTNLWDMYDSYRQGCTVVVATERNCWPDSNLAKLYPEPAGPYINAGGFVGPPQMLIRTMETLLEHSVDGNDQHSWHRAYVAGALPHVVLDSNKWIFACAADGLPEIRPCVLHWNGNTPGREEYWKEFCAADQPR